MAKHESWQYAVSRFRRPDGGIRTQRKLKYDLCPVCQENRKYISSKQCRQCFETKNNWDKEAYRVLRRFLAAIDEKKPVKKHTIKKARILVESKDRVKHKEE